jgi:alpha-ketoglutarate-dependent 2,4-dichlorophenoxyacetate dioxygenase
MTIKIQPVDPVSRPFFAGEVSGIDITRPLTPDQASVIEAGMDQYGVLVFRGQKFGDETQLAFSRNFGRLEEATGDLDWGKPRRIESGLVNDISNLDNDNQVLAWDNRRRLFSLGNRLWHSDSSFKEVSRQSSPCCPRV